jgi:gliding motility-associated-like protein
VNGDANIQGFNRNSREAGLGTISPCEYWNINRTNGNSNVTVTLGWDDQRGCSLLNTLSQLNVARWNGTIWENRGNNSQQGIVSSGFVTSTVNNNFGSFAISTKSIDLYASAVWIEDCLTPGNGQFFNTSGTGIDLINQDQNNTFEQDFGIHQQNSNSLILRGAEIKTYKNNSSNVCSPRLNYRVFESNATPGNFIPLPLSFFSDCNGTNFVNGGGPCVQGQQKWQSVVAAGNSSPFSPVNLTNLPPGNYTIQVYYDMNGSNTFTNACTESFVYNNNGNYYSATFTIILPSITVNQPDTCNAFGSIEVTDLVANTVFNVTYLKNGVATDTIAYTTSANGEITIDSLTIGGYSEVTFLINGCEIKSPETFSLINPTLYPNFNLIQVLCENSIAPALVNTSTNGISGSWSPSSIDSNIPGTFEYTFSPGAGQCAVDTTISVTITDKIFPLFDSIPTICQYSAAPLLNGISNNGITGTWNPAIIDTISTGATTYIFTPDGNQCAANDSMIVTVDSLITPEFNPISNLCQNTTAPLLPGISNNGISGSWEPSVIDMNNSGSSIYTFTPSEEHCNAETTINIIVGPQITPIFSPIPDICENSNAPVLPTNSNNGITGTWTPSTIDSSIIGSTNYFFLPSLGQCATSSSLTVTVLSKIIPLFDSIPTICQYSAAPLLNGISNNGVTGEWLPAIINTEVAGIVTYEFTPSSELCATNSILTINILSEDDAICNLDIEIPEAFTPDIDNLNDFFEIKGIQNYSNNQLTIYNRWGNEVYFKSGYNNDWDGTANRGLVVGDEKLPTSTYYYILDLNGDGKTIYKGYVYLER